jgi:hypothetical protein
MRRHRPAYLAPSRTFTHHVPSQQHVVSGSGHDLNVPLLVEIPVQTPPEVVSPPSSVGSEASFRPLSASPPCTPPPHTQRRIVKLCFRLYHFLLDLLLLMFVCVMGLFFDVEVQVMKQDKRRSIATGRGSGRVIIQTRDRYDGNHKHYLSSNLLRSPPRSQNSSLGQDDCYRDPDEVGIIV